MTKKIVVANWKANKTVDEARGWLKEWQETGIRPPSEIVEIVIAAPYPIISYLHNNNVEAMGFSLGSQDVSAYPAGQYTGEVPATLLSSMGVKYSLVGHSERRRFLKETNLEVEQKAKMAIEADIRPIICAQNETELPDNLRNFSEKQFILMYEPMDAISQSGEFKDIDLETITKTVESWKTKLKVNDILYGGSVNPTNCRAVLATTGASGMVIGHASLSGRSFAEIIKNIL